MKKRIILLSAMLMSGISMINAQNVYISVQQDGTKIDKLGTAAFDVSSSPTVEFVDGKVVMTIGSNTVAKLPMSDGGQLTAEFSTTVAAADLNKVTKTSTSDYATLYSPFQLTVPSGSGVDVYAPTYDTKRCMLTCTSETKIASGEVIPVETALLLKNAGTMEFAISDGASTVISESALSGSSLSIGVPTMESGYTLYTLGREASDATQYGFFSYAGKKLGAGLAYLVEPTISASQAKYVQFNFFDEATAIGKIENGENANYCGKYILNGRVVIVKNGSKFNLSGQEIK